MYRASQCLGITQLRVMTAERLREQDEPLIVFSHSQPVAALVPYETYLRWQAVFERIREHGVAP